MLTIEERKVNLFTSVDIDDISVSDFDTRDAAKHVRC